MAKREKKQKNKNNELDETTGLRQEHYKRLLYLDRLNNKKNDTSNQYFKMYNKSIKEVITFKEAEIIFKLPKNTIVQDAKRGMFPNSVWRKSGGTYLITLKAANKMYKDYWQTRAMKDISYLYSGYDGNKMSEAEYFILYGDPETDEPEQDS